MKTNELIEKIESLLKEYENGQNVIVDDISIYVTSVKANFEKEYVINHGIKLKVRLS